ncbi:hypothetical protein TSACC_22973 [Terrimicrobium sacchariphilum]|uniref:Uncharacterized protein n=2 Tax=Terrimicrobium sacchariphilum TaxID=690879 RepID=A0A146GDE8_TERSA|nr:hypothetical protein TSACC_22973 [Terrimicrobium sacchariphilum]
MPLCAAIANPIAIDSEQRLTTMLAEDVVITVDRDASSVSGRYVFQQQKDVWPEVRDSHVLICVPVLLPKGGAAAYEHRYGTPTVTIGDRAFPTKAGENFYPDILPAQVRLPKGWHFAVYEAKIPLSAVARKFDASIHYVQPNFPGHIAGYVPIHPPEPAGKSKIVFVPANGHALRPAGFLATFRRPVERIEFTPQNQKLVTARFVSR